MRKFTAKHTHVAVHRIKHTLAAKQQRFKASAANERNRREVPIAGIRWAKTTAREDGAGPAPSLSEASVPPSLYGSVAARKGGGRTWGPAVRYPSLSVR